MKSLERQIVLLTGATGGLGREFAMQLKELGANLILTDLNEAELNAFVKDLTRHGRGEILGAFTGNCDSREGADEIAKAAFNISSRIDMLINNAGIAHAGDFADIPQEKWELLMQINLLTPMRLCHAVIPQMKARGSGHIVNVSSIAGIVPLVGGAPYTASKHGLKGFSDALRIEYEKYGIYVSSVHPFFTRTAILHSERFGSGAIVHKQLPDAIVDEPQKIIAETIAAIRSNKGVILPGLTAKGLDFMRRHFPDLVEYGLKQFNDHF